MGYLIKIIIYIRPRIGSLFISRVLEFIETPNAILLLEVGDKISGITNLECENFGEYGMLETDECIHAINFSEVHRTFSTIVNFLSDSLDTLVHHYTYFYLFYNSFNIIYSYFTVIVIYK